jgi:hypothetical protein
VEPYAAPRQAAAPARGPGVATRRGTPAPRYPASMQSVQLASRTSDLPLSAPWSPRFPQLRTEPKQSRRSSAARHSRLRRSKINFPRQPVPPSHFSTSPRPQATFPVALYPASTPGKPTRRATAGAAPAPCCGSSPAARPARIPPQIDACEPPRYSGHLLRPSPAAAGPEFGRRRGPVRPGVTLQERRYFQGDLCKFPGTRL